MTKAEKTQILSIDVTQLCHDWPSISDHLDQAVDAAIAELDHPRKGELSVVLSDDAHVRILNRDYRGKDRSTNVLSFPMPESTGLLGDVVFALETVEREAIEQNKTFTDHFIHLLIHGMMHLQGLDHEDEAEALDMEAREVRALARLSIDNPYRLDNR